jgi:beta-lactamase regulating signal transducer with metallopeptidase domain
MSQVELLGILAAAAVKSAAILALAGLVTIVWRGTSASTRHLVWTIGVSSALLVPALGAVAARLNGPAIRVAVWTPPAQTTGTEKFRSQARESAPQVSTGFQYATASEGARSSASAAPFASTLNSTAPTTLDTDDPVLSAVSYPEATTQTARPTVQPATSILARIADFGLNELIYLYMGGAVVTLLPVLIGVVRLRVVAGRARIARNRRWSDLVSRTPAIAHFAGRVRIVESEHHSMPMTWGILEPTLLVPANSEEWPDWKCRNILLHELAHVERRDCLTQLVAQVACSAYWFNPLVWVAAHRMRIERELACDDKVISAGSAASDYASNLLDVARSLRAPSFTSSTAIAMARPSQLSGRLLAVLDATRNRSGITRGIRAAVSGAAVAIVIPMSFIIPGASSSVPVTPASGKQALPSQKQKTSAFSSHALATIATGARMPSAVAVLSNTISSPQTGMVPLISASSFVTSIPQTPGCYIGDGKGGTSIQSNSSDDNRSRPTYNIRYTRDNCSLEVTAEGKFTLRPDLSDLETIASDGWFRVEERVGRESHRVEIRRADNGSLDHQYWVNGDRTPYNDEARAWLARTLLTIERRTAVAASSRVPQLYRSGGVRGVMSEIALMEGEYPKSIYYKTFLGMGVSLDANTLNSIVKQSATDLVKSDYYLAEVLSEFAKQPSVNETTWRTFAEAAGGMKSDYYKSEVLKKVLKSGRLSPQTVGILLNSASSIKSDYYLSDLLQSVASQYAVNADTRQYYVNALRNIESDYYRGEVLKTLDNDGSWDARTSQLVLASASDIKSDYYRAEALSNLVKSSHVTDWPSFFNSVAGIGSDYYKKAALSTVLEQRPLSRDVVTGVLSVVPRMKSDSEASEVLSKVASSYRIDDSLRPAFEKAVDSIDSDYYRGSALSALRRSMAR